jgi:hypothetical protein
MRNKTMYFTVLKKSSCVTFVFKMFFCKMNSTKYSKIEEINVGYFQRHDFLTNFELDGIQTLPIMTLSCRHFIMHMLHRC